MLSFDGRYRYGILIIYTLNNIAQPPYVDSSACTSFCISPDDACKQTSSVAVTRSELEEVGLQAAPLSEKYSI